MAPGDTAREYHRRTSVSPETLAPLVLDLPTFPSPCKVYPDGLPEVVLPDAWGRPAALDLAALARILHLSAGVVRTSRRPDGRVYHFRAAGSAGGRAPYEVYVAARDVAGLDDGVHWYDPVGHALRRIGPPADGATTLVVTGIPWRTGWQYKERGFRHIYWDVGSMLAQTLALVPSARLFTRFPDAAVTRLVGADGVHEWPVALVALAPGDPAVAPGGAAVAGEVDVHPPVEYPLLTEAQHAGDGDVLGEPWPDDPPAFADLEDVILRRGSTRIMDPLPVPRELLAACLGAGLRGRHFVAVHAVDGVAPGLYEWPRLVRAGDLREELFHVCMEQGLGRDAAFVVMAVADLEALDDRGYREAQLIAGIDEGRIHLAAFAGGAGATGMTFYDSELEALLGEPLAGLLFTCVGRPAYRNRRGGGPRAPVPIGTMLPRDRRTHMEHTIDPDRIHHAWDASLEPTLRIEPGDTVHFDIKMAGSGQVDRGAAYEDARFDFDTLYNLLGPVYVEGAEPGDTLEVEIVSLQTGEWGWTAVMPELGLLPEDFPEPFMRYFDLTQGDTTELAGARIPIEPFLGTMGVLPDDIDQASPFPPHKGGGNIDTRHLKTGTTLLLPVFREGALFSCGDPHAAQGDGEVCVAAIETDMRATLRFGLRKRSISTPRFIVPGALTPRLDDGGHYGTMGIHEDLMQGAKISVRAMIDLLEEEHGLSREDAYVLCSVAGDLKILEIVDAGVWNVGFTVPRALFA